MNVNVIQGSCNKMSNVYKKKLQEKYEHKKIAAYLYKWRKKN